MQLAQHSLDLRRVVKNLKELHSKEFKNVMQSEHFMDVLPLTSQEKSALKSTFTKKEFAKNPEDKQLKVWF